MVGFCWHSMISISDVALVMIPMMIIMIIIHHHINPGNDDDNNYDVARKLTKGSNHCHQKSVLLVHGLLLKMMN